MRAALRRGWDATRYLVGGLGTALPALLLAVPFVFLVVPLSLLFVGLPWLPEVLRPLRALANAERGRAGHALGRTIPEPYAPPHGSDLARAWRLLRSPATWRDLAWMVAHGCTGLVAATLALGLWPSVVYTLSMPLWWWAMPEGTVQVFVPLTSWPTAMTLPFLQAAAFLTVLVWALPRLARFQVRLAEWLLRPTRREHLARRVERLTETRAGALEAHAAELHRIERDLHDGTQAQLVSVAMRLGLAVRGFHTTPEESLRLVKEAREGVEDTLTQLRGVIRGIYPPILADRGLGGAVRALAAGQRAETTVDLPDDIPRCPAAVEAAAYFAIAEALTNATRHSGASRVAVVLRHDGTTLRITVRDNGAGGADPASGSGLAGIGRRVAALDGTTEIDSPIGDGTTLRVELPCAS
ncbi:MAG TPA: sensor domain-containing protein [Thermomonospora sp.]|nr:sensor domain-containing protein [Thermomonospora sp.]